MTNANVIVLTSMVVPFLCATASHGALSCRLSIERGLWPPLQAGQVGILSFKVRAGRFVGFSLYSARFFVALLLLT